MMPQNGLIKLDKDANMDYNDRGNLTIFIMISLAFETYSNPHMKSRNKL